jgi:3',5'-cyclic AMP phosphodiesterase CpdA
MVSLAHLSDLHATPVRVDQVRAFMNKRLLGLASWRMRRSKAHRGEVLEALIEDLATVEPDHVAVTGDLTNVSSPHEFEAARTWLERIGTGQNVSVVPGNHDAYVRVPRSASWDLWSEFMDSDGGDEPSCFPTLRVRGSLAIVGVCSALPTLPLFASGAIGREQLERLEKLLSGLTDSGLCRVVLIHHPPTPGAVSPRRALRDARAFRQLLSSTGAELVLHGHGHRTRFGSIDGPRGPIPVVGVRSSSDLGEDPERRAQYHVYEIESAGSGSELRITTRIRGYDSERGCFSDEGERRL